MCTKLFILFQISEGIVILLPTFMFFPEMCITTFWHRPTHLVFLKVWDNKNNYQFWALNVCHLQF